MQDTFLVYITCVREFLFQLSRVHRDKHCNRESMLYVKYKLFEGSSEHNSSIAPPKSVVRQFKSWCIIIICCNTIGSRSSKYLLSRLSYMKYYNQYFLRPSMLRTNFPINTFFFIEFTTDTPDPECYAYGALTRNIWFSSCFAFSQVMSETKKGLETSNKILPYFTQKSTKGIT